MKVSHIITLCCIVFVATLNASDTELQRYVDRYYLDWNAPRDSADDTSFWLIPRFQKEVPLAMRAEVLDKILDRATSARPSKAYNVITFALMYLREIGSSDDLSAHAKSNIVQLANDPNWTIRRDVFEVLEKLGKASDRDLLVAGLTDPDDRVRGAALDAFLEQSNSESVYRVFIQEHEGDSNYTTSVQYARASLKNVLLHKPVP